MTTLLIFSLRAKVSDRIVLAYYILFLPRMFPHQIEYRFIHGERCKEQHCVKYPVQPTVAVPTVERYSPGAGDVLADKRRETLRVIDI
jgi:hypothetical protein